MAASIQMHCLRPPRSTNVSALMVKLTDESLAALKSARSAGHEMRLIVEGQGGSLEIGDGIAKFRFVVQQLPGPTSDTIQWNRAQGYSTVASIATKIQIQATDKTFAETREKAQKLADEEKKKSTKDVNRRPRDQRAVVHRPVSHSTSRFAPKPSSSAAPQHKPWTDSTSSKISPPKAPAPSTTTSQTARPSMSSALRAELMKKSLRQRVVHAVILSKYSRDGVLERLRKDGLNDGDEQRVGAIIDEVSESGKDGQLSLKPALFSEVDVNKWQWFTTEEKIKIKRILSGTTSSTPTNFAPSRKSGMAPPQAPAPVSYSTSPDALTAPAKSSPPSKSPANGNPLDGLLPPPAKRKREQPSTNGAAEKRPPLHSQSPPEDPKDSPPSMNGSLGRPAPSANWDSRFPDIQSDEDAGRYYRLFHKDYPMYMTCYKTLADVAKEFSDLERQLSEAPRDTKEHKKVERSIQTKFSHYQKDSDFQRMRQQHGDLRAKLAVLKKRITDWERQSQTQNQPPHPTDSPHLQHVDDLMVM